MTLLHTRSLVGGSKLHFAEAFKADLTGFLGGVEKRSHYWVSDRLPSSRDEEHVHSPNHELVLKGWLHSRVQGLQITPVQGRRITPSVTREASKSAQISSEDRRQTPFSRRSQGWP